MNELAIGTVCESKVPIFEVSEVPRHAICKVTAVVPSSLRRTPELPEYQVERVDLPVTAYLRHDDLIVVASE